MGGLIVFLNKFGITLFQEDGSFRDMNEIVFDLLDIRAFVSEADKKIIDAIRENRYL